MATTDLPILIQTLNPYFRSISTSQNMKWIAEPEILKPLRFEIEHDPLVGFYFYVFDGGKCIHDESQDTFELAVESAFEGYNVPKVPKEIWKKSDAP